MRHLQILLLASTAALAACGTETAPATSGGGGGGTVTATPSPTPAPSAPPTATPNPTPSPTPPPTSGMTGDPTQDAMLEVMLTEHNAARAEVGVPALILDNDLNSQALAYAEEMARTGLFQHSQGSDRPNQGENLWAGTAGAFAYERMVGAFIDEKQFYIHAAFPNVSTTGNWQDVGHYTQIVWRNTTHFGCGIATGLGRDWLVCRYSPPGNWVGQFAY